MDDKYFIIIPVVIAAILVFSFGYNIGFKDGIKKGKDNLRKDAIILDNNSLVKLSNVNGDNTKPKFIQNNRTVYCQSEDIDWASLQVAIRCWKNKKFLGVNNMESTP